MQFVPIFKKRVVHHELQNNFRNLTQYKAPAHTSGKAPMSHKAYNRLNIFHLDNLQQQ
jgi:hypothetical protein